MAVNVPLLESVLTYIRDHPEEWDQSQWICKTTACFAGRTVLMEGFTPNFNDPALRFPGVGGAGDTWIVMDEHGDKHDVEDLAIALLGINERDSDKLFRSDKSFDDLERAVKDIVNEAKSAS